MVAVLATGQDLIDRKDARVIADLCSDSNSPVSPNAVTTHPKVLIALEDAEGEVIGTLQALGRYDETRLLALTGSAKAFLKKIIVELAMVGLISRRPSLETDDIEKLEKLHDLWLKRLQEGSAIFADDTTDDSASRPSVDGATLGELSNLNMLRERSRYFAARVLPEGRNH
jgi:hypothetical protein